MYEYKICKEIGIADLDRKHYGKKYIKKMHDVAKKTGLHAFGLFTGIVCWGGTTHYLLRIEFSSKRKMKNFIELLKAINEVFIGYAKVSYHINSGVSCVAGKLDYEEKVVK